MNVQGYIINVWKYDEYFMTSFPSHPHISWNSQSSDSVDTTCTSCNGSRMFLERRSRKCFIRRRSYGQLEHQRGSNWCECGTLGLYPYFEMIGNITSSTCCMKTLFWLLLHPQNWPTLLMFIMFNGWEKKHCLINVVSWRCENNKYSPDFVFHVSLVFISYIKAFQWNVCLTKTSKHTNDISQLNKDLVSIYLF